MTPDSFPLVGYIIWVAAILLALFLLGLWAYLVWSWAHHKIVMHRITRSYHRHARELGYRKD